MAAYVKKLIGLGTVPNDDTGDDLRVAGGKINDNNDEVFGAITFEAGGTNALTFNALNEMVPTNPLDASLVGIRLGGSGAANLLDDFEKGAFAPTIQDTTFSDAEGQTHSVQTGRYTKIGDTVHIELTLVITSLGTLTTTSQGFIGNLPFVPSAIQATPLSIGRSSALNLTAGEIPVVMTVASATRIEINKWSGTGGTLALLLSEITGSATLRIAGEYKI